ncbi:glycoside hydrolase family 25 protein [Pisolithus tinctorius]|uniref:N,O-diacetylmuramidase n=1 Tax=Pisolithus tinctorius Marx 270 TaxID=870435 RepID=A0A0C3NI80_PISTI|nr:glycoside hydrolase family 25 protein [Pisolithus tinctorius]KIN95380.1 glycoside hydrolase family 25 protein [Pisolithus tinctorius Marx 270]
MKYLASLVSVLAVTEGSPVKHAYPQGIDVSDYQPNIDWTTVVNNGIVFVYIKATEGTSYISPSFSSQYTGATNAGLIRGGYHFAHPDKSSGATQANYFLAHGGGWSADGITLPGALDIEYNPNGAECYGLTASEMITWIKDFSNTYHAATSRYPVIYTTMDWWSTCTGNSASFASDNPLWIADWSSTLGTLPAGWAYTSFWQYADSGPNPGDADLWNGDVSGLQRMALGS